MEPQRTPDGVDYRLTDILAVDAEAAADDDGSLNFEPILIDLLEQEVLPAMIANIGGFSLPIPPLDLGGGQSIAIDGGDATRDAGNTLLQGAPIGQTP